MDSGIPTTTSCQLIHLSRLSSAGLRPYTGNEGRRLLSPSRPLLVRCVCFPRSKGACRMNDGPLNDRSKSMNVRSSFCTRLSNQSNSFSSSSSSLALSLSLSSLLPPPSLRPRPSFCVPSEHRGSAFVDGNVAENVSAGTANRSIRPPHDEEEPTRSCVRAASFVSAR